MKKNFYAIIISFLFSVILWISISLSNDYYATFEVPVKLIDFPAGYSTGSPLPETVSIKLKGKGWKLVSLELSTATDFDIPIGYEYGRRYANLYNFIPDNPWLTSDVEVTSIAPDTLSFFIEKAFTKKVKIYPDVDLGFKPDYGLASQISVLPDSVVVYGPYSYLKGLDSIKTQTLKLTDLEAKITKQVPLEKIEGMQYKYNSVKIYLDVQKIVDRNFDNVFVKVIDAPSDKEVLLLPNKITVGLRGGVDILGKVDTSQVKAFVNYSEIATDSLGSVLPQIVCPGNISFIYSKPERLRYVLKKFN